VGVGGSGANNSDILCDPKKPANHNRRTYYFVWNDGVCFAILPRIVAVASLVLVNSACHCWNIRLDWISLLAKYDAARRRHGDLRWRCGHIRSNGTCASPTGAPRASSRPRRRGAPWSGNLICVNPRPSLAPSVALRSRYANRKPVESYFESIRTSPSR